MCNLKSNSVGILVGILASLIWGSWPVFSKVAITHSLSPLDIASLRFTIAGIILFPVLLYHSIKLRMIFSKGVILAIGAGAPYVLLAMYGIKMSSSTHFGAIAPSTMLVFSTIGSIVFLKEALTLSRCIGVAAIVTGVVWIGLSNLQNISTDTIFGDMMFIGCGALWASFTLLSKYWQVDSWSATALVSVVSGIICAPFSIEVIKNNPVDLIVWHGVYQGVLVAILALYCYAKCVSILGAAKGALFSALVPPVSILLSLTFLDESITINEVMGSIVVGVGTLLALGIVKLNALRTSLEQ
ncbi:DMT family transporter [Photobacterium alginatilyticum]|uniref:DMT family transporter n=1 Tax=Photobacterium alginatilyticum TaxID=1775171 RepID=A0ABW9YBM7_9GAMM|nr:DMT family transporter [Photobacterium alginatilyticum]